MSYGRSNNHSEHPYLTYVVSIFISHGIIWKCLLKIDDIEEKDDDEITTQQSKMLDE